MSFDLLRPSLFAAVLIALGGYIYVYRPLETTVADRYAQLDASRATLVRSLELARRIPALARERTALEGRFARVHVRDQQAAMVERFLRAVAEIAARDGVAVESVASDAPPTYTAARTVRGAPFDELPLDLTLRGHYRDVIHAIREVNDGDVAARITLASLRDADRRPGERPQLNAAFHVRLLQEADESTTNDTRPH
jgi:Tfp pilus assembly protein PilO